MESLTGRTALITGASSGVGAAVGRALHAAGVRVALLSRRGDDLGLDGSLPIATDVRDRDALEAAAAQTVGRFGALTRPRTMRVLTTTFRPMSEGTFG